MKSYYCIEKEDSLLLIKAYCENERSLSNKSKFWLDKNVIKIMKKYIKTKKNISDHIFRLKKLNKIPKSKSKSLSLKLQNSKKVNNQIEKQNSCNSDYSNLELESESESKLDFKSKNEREKIKKSRKVKKKNKKINL